MEYTERSRSPDKSRQESPDWLDYQRALREYAVAKSAVDEALRAAWADKVEQNTNAMRELLKPHQQRAKQAEKALEEASDRWMTNPRYAEHPIPRKPDAELSK